ncbi:hypothetical protein NQ176_g5212 [Zarea fungicola]|uniref:Uncharacterized protein n=1 Tax=Zarea fungicola TaxID=93591 RepID=A0ACC1N9L5_9HYPO|nr:hypothetical protein NQ176_g5212 [Lecanicillium fungicola]
MASERTESEIIIFDTPSKNGKTWSHHVLRILFAVHYKGLPYSFKGVEYPDIVATFEPTTLERKDDPVEPYEIPVVCFQTRAGIPQYHMEPLKILQALEDIQPEPSLLHNSPRSVEYRSRFGPAFAPIIQLVVGHVPDILSERSATAFSHKRQSRWGKSVEQWVAEHPIESGLNAAEPKLKEFGDWLELTPGPFINGSQAGYADFTVVSFLGFAKAVGLEGVFTKLLGMHPAIERLYSAVKLTQQGNVRCQDLFGPNV